MKQQEAVEQETSLKAEEQTKGNIFTWIITKIKELFARSEEQDTRTAYLESELCKKDDSYGFCPKL